MYRIGEFSYLCECTIKTLRHYEKMGILIPKEVDDFTGYRYYSEEQVSTYHNIKTYTESELEDYIKNVREEMVEEQVKKLKKQMNESLDINEKLNILKRIEKIKKEVLEW